MSLRFRNVEYIRRRWPETLWPEVSARIEAWQDRTLPEESLAGYTVARLRQAHTPAAPEQALSTALDRLIPEETENANPSTYHLLVLGFGPLLPDLVAQAQPRHLLVYEPQVWRLLWSLDHLDWEAVFAPVPAIHFVLNTVPALTLLDVLRFHNNLMCEDVILAHSGGDTAIMAEQITALRPHLFHGWSAMAKRLRCLHNSRQLMQNAQARLWQPHPPRQQAPPVMIVGSGPSAELLMDEIRRLAPSCLVVAAGTAAHVLLQGGVVPDISVIAGENRGYYNEHHLCVERWPIMRTVPLLLNQAADPRFAEFRTPLALFGYPDNPLPCGGVQTPAMTAPTVTNAAMALLAEAGFCDLLFFGIDMGARRLEHRYATTHPRVDVNAIPYADGYNPDMPLRVRGNFGGQVFTSPLFDQARLAFEGFLATHPQVNVRNCGDGALIRGAQPCIAKKLTLGEPLPDKAARVAALWQEFPPHDPAACAAVWDEVRFQAELETLRTALLQALECDSPYDIADALWPLLHHHRPLLALRLMADSLLGMISLTLTRLNRLSPSDRAAVLPQARQRLITAVDDLCAQTATTLHDLSSGQDGPWLIWDEA